MKKTSFLLTSAASLALSAGTVSAATILHVASPDVGGNEINISVLDGKAAYNGNGASGQFGDGTVTDYRLFRDDVTNAIETFGTKGTRISDISRTGDYSFDRRTYLDFWATSDPGATTGGIPAFNTAADFDFQVDGEFTAIGHDGMSGSINIGGLGSGSLYFIYGTFNDGYTLELTMTGTGADLSDSVDVNGGGTLANQATIDGYWISEFSFDNASGDYDTIDYSITGVNGHFAGVVMDATAVPEPSTAVLVGLAGLGLMVRRRR